ILWQMNYDRAVPAALELLRWTPTVRMSSRDSRTLPFPVFGIRSSVVYETFTMLTRKIS
ncbi:hypothetical protein BaRGS_00009325, partial [Batillaria attramentaria]